MKRIFLSLLAVFGLTITQAQEQPNTWEKWGPTGENGSGVIVRAGYTIGGTSPIPLPNEIRSINEFSPKGGATVGMDVYKMFSRRWGVALACRFFYEGFHTGADVKNYKISLTMEGNTMAGYFTGTNATNTEMWGVTLPILVTCRISPRWNISVGPYLSHYFKKTFEGEVYDNKNGVGYLRVGDFTGEKVEITRQSPATYDFKDNMLPWNGGLEFVFDWKAMKHMNVFASLDWGLSNILEKDFETVPFKMYPIYATFGAAYRY